MSSLSSAFRPQGLPVAPVTASGDRAAGGDAGLRVLVISGPRSVASIDGRVVRIGDTVNGMRVTRIDRAGVVLTGEGGAKEQLAITPTVVKRKAVGAAPSPSAGARP